MLPLFFWGVQSRVYKSEYDTLQLMPSLGFGTMEREHDPDANTEYAYVTTYIGDKPSKHNMLQVFLLGYTLKRLSPRIDRILLLPTNIQLDPKDYAKIQKLYTHIIYRPFVKWPCRGPEQETEDKQHYFELNIFTLTKYRKLLFIGGIVLFVRDPSPIFHMPAPAAPPDIQAWFFSKYGAVLNCDFFLIQPSLADFDGLRNYGCDYICNFSMSIDSSATIIRHVVPPGPYANGLFTQYFNGNISTLSWTWCYELPGHYIDQLNQVSRIDDDRIISYRYPFNLAPWVERTAHGSQLYVKMVQEMFQSFGEIADLNSYDLVMPTEPHQIRKMQGIRDPNHDAIIFYPEFGECTNEMIIIRAVIVFFGSFGLLVAALTWENVLGSRKLVFLWNVS